MNTSDKYILSSLDNALTVLNLFVVNEELSPSEISKLTEINRSTVFRFLVTLENRGYLTREENGKYRLGIKLFTLGQLFYSRMELASQIHPYLQKITEKTGETSHLVIMDNATQVTFIDKAVGSLWLKLDMPLGFREYAHHTGTGKAILAFQSEQFINQYIRSAEFTCRTSSSISDAKELLLRLDSIRETGYACDNEECEIGLTCYAVPLIDASGRAIAAISSSGPTTRMVSRKEIHIDELKYAADKISVLLK